MRVKNPTNTAVACSKAVSESQYGRVGRALAWSHESQNPTKAQATLPWDAKESKGPAPVPSLCSAPALGILGLPNQYDDSEWQVLLFLIRDGESIVKKFALHKLQIIQQRGGMVGIPTQISPQSPHSSHTCCSCDKE